MNVATHTMSVAGSRSRPHAPAAPDRYCRLFAEAPDVVHEKFTPEVLEKLAQSMRGEDSPIPANCRQGHKPPAVAVTYFGQFIDHDLTLDSTPVREAGCCEPIYTINHRTPWLDLDHLYGDGPRSTRHHHLYESDDASFRIGHSPRGGEPFDVPLTYDGRPALADDRNGENIILRQIHAMFLKLHNVAVRELPATLPPRERFDRARERVRWQYQWLVRNWYLRQICHPEIYHAVIEEGDRRIDWSHDGFAIPVEFAVAAMRFGHSMVRRDYQLREKGRLTPLSDLFGVQNNRALDSDLKVDWEFFSSSKFPASADPIDTNIAEPLFELPDEHIDLYVRSPIPHPPQALPTRTLTRGAAMRLPTGQQVRDALGETDIPAPTCEYKFDPWQPLRDRGLDRDTPLWYYILLEAQLDPGIPGTRSGFGATIGKLGSRLVAEVIEASLLHDSTSFLRRKEPTWKPEPWTSPDGEPIDLSDLTHRKPLFARVAQIAGV